MLRNLFGAKKEQDPTPEELAQAEEARRLAELTEKLQKAIAEDPAFRIITIDGLQWICPYTGSRLDASFGIDEPALKHLMTQQPWKKAKLRPLAELQRYRWTLFLKDNLAKDQRLQNFNGERWLNPLNGEWVVLWGFNGTVTPPVLEAMAAAMANCAESLKAKIKSHDELAKLVKAAGGEISGGHLVNEQHAVTRVSGVQADPRATHTTLTGNDLDLAGGILSKILSPMPTVPGWEFATLYEPHAQVGGDFYEVQRLDGDRWLILVGDVTGHGVQGAMVVVSAIKALRFVLKQERTLVGILAKLNDEVKGDLLDGQFITCFAGILDSGSGKFECVCAGHHPAIMVRREGNITVERIGERGVALGLARGDTFRRSLHPVTVQIEPGDKILQFTDGFTEAVDSKDREFGEMRLIGHLLSSMDGSFADALPQIAAAARRHSMGTLADDATLLAFSRVLPPES